MLQLYGACRKVVGKIVAGIDGALCGGCSLRRNDVHAPCPKDLSILSIYIKTFTDEYPDLFPSIHDGSWLITSICRSSGRGDLRTTETPARGMHRACYGRVYLRDPWLSRHFIRYRSTAQYQSLLKPSQSGFDERTEYRKHVSAPIYRPLDAASPNAYRTHEPSIIRKTVQSENFEPWLEEHLAFCARASEDRSYIAYVKEIRQYCQRRRLAPRSSRRDRLLGNEAQGLAKHDHARLLSSLRKAFQEGGQTALDTQLLYSYRGYITSKSLSKTTLADQRELADLRYPEEWYPATRYMQRQIHLHVGPTNSGKTYQALKRLEEAGSGIYAGPLRLLAHEVYSRLKAKGMRCDLLTGDERIFAENVQGTRVMQSCTVEMIPLNRKVDVAVIDEIQMMGDDARGWAWTQALLGIRAKELHLCGEERTVPLIRELATLMGDNLEIHTYKRLSPLRTMSTSLKGQLGQLRKGDCVVVFSRLGIHAMKKGIERVTKRRVAIVYGSLPPEIRAQQARLFNDPDNDYDILVASDAIGMGLNLAIKRIVFESIQKFNGTSLELLQTPQIKQIGGRAGRFRIAMQAGEEALTDPPQSTATHNLGFITTLDEIDLPVVRKAMRSDP